MGLFRLAPLIATTVLLTACIPVPLGSHAPDIEETQATLHEADAARIRISPESRLDYVVQFSQALDRDYPSVDARGANADWADLFPDDANESAVTLAEVYTPEVRERIRAAGIDYLVVLLPLEHEEPELTNAGPFLGKSEEVRSAAATLLHFDGGVEATTYGIEAIGGDAEFWPGIYFFVFTTTSDAGEGAQSLVAAVGDAIEAPAGGGNATVLVVASDP